MNKATIGLLALASMLTAAAGAVTPDPYYDLHIIAVDKDGSAMWPRVGRSGAGFHAAPKRMTGELLEDEPAQDPQGLPQFRAEYYKYISRIFDEIRRTHPKRVVFYIHGGMNVLKGAIEKGARLAEEEKGRESEEYRISICWSSNLYSTYWEHLTGNVEGLSNPTVGALTSPLTLLSDVGGAVCSAPRTLIRIFSNDRHAAHPGGFSRDHYALARMTELAAKPGLGVKNAVDVSLGADERSLRPGALAMDAAAWTVTKPAKILTAPLIDDLGGGAWQMMLRRTRTMFERESSIESNYVTRDPARRELNRVSVEKGRLVRAHPLTARQLAFNERAEYAARLGAVRLFFEEAAKLIADKDACGGRIPETVLIGHSMGAIVTNEILGRFSEIQFDQIVFLAAACTANDFCHAGIPYLRLHPRSHFYNVCLHPAAERSEAQPGKLTLADPVYLPLELAPRGSLLVWIDSFLDHPASEGDRTLGRWENAILLSDAVPQSILGQMTLKGFGRDRTRAGTSRLVYTTNYNYRSVKSGGLIKNEYFAEPREHGQFSRTGVKGDNSAQPDFDFTNPTFWKAEKPGNR